MKMKIEERVREMEEKSWRDNSKGREKRVEGQEELEGS